MSRINNENDAMNEEVENIDVRASLDDTIVVEGMEYPVLALRDLVVLPGNSASLFVGRELSLAAADAAYKCNTPLVLVTQKNPQVEVPKKDDLYMVGITARIKRYTMMPDGTLNIAVEGINRIKIESINEFNNYYTAYIKEYDYKDDGKDKAEYDALMAIITEEFRARKIDYNVAKESISVINNPRSVKEYVAAICGNVELNTQNKQTLLECETKYDLLVKLLEFMSAERQKEAIEERIKDRVKAQMERNQRDYYLSEQMRAIQKELYEGGNKPGEEGELDAYERRIRTTKLSKEAREKAQNELKKLKMAGAMNAESTIIRNYLDWILDLPWGKYSKVKHDLNKAIEILDEDHYGLEKVKERIIEFLAVQARSKNMKSPILCLVGAPGVGKTSLGKSIAKATGRKFVRTALGGVRDESEIRGHRRTYVGAMPGKILQNIKKVGVANPLFLLDEIDKMGSDWRGDPSSALLEVLDPEQNSSFNDHYLEVDYDLSKVMFVTTANSLNMPRPLLDRMEIIRIEGYTENEKIEIAKRHLIPKVFAENGVKPSELMITDKAIIDIIRYYTSESGVRGLEKQIAAVARKSVKSIMLEGKKEGYIVVDENNLKDYLGVQRYHYGVKKEKNVVGVTTGLAWTEFGGDILFIEAVDMPGKGAIKQTGQLGDVMKESIETAYSVVKSHAVSLGIDIDVFEKTNVHVHVPEGATPKDGPSAGIAMYTTLVSVFTKIPVKNDVAMTGEITLQGRILPIGGLKEKLLAALRGGIKTVIIPIDNEKDLEEIPENAKKGLNIVLASNVTEILDVALERPVCPLN